LLHLFSACPMDARKARTDDERADRLLLDVLPMIRTVAVI
jgi:hypothetical protein